MTLVSFTYSIPYLLALTLFFVLAFQQYRVAKSRLANQRIRIIAISIFVLFFGFRGLVGWDWSSYYVMYENFEPLWGDCSLNFQENSDVGYVLYMTAVKSMFVDYQMFIFISVILDAIVLNLIFKRYSSNYALSFAVFMVVSLGMEIDTLRNAKSIMVVLLALSYIQERKLLSYMAMMLLAISLHSSAVFFIPFYFFAYKKMPIKVFIAIFIMGNIIYILQVPFIKPMITWIVGVIGGKYAIMADMYLNSDIYGEARGITISYLERFGTTMLVILYYNKLHSLKKSNVLFINIFIIYMITSLYMSEVSVLFARVGALFVISYWIIWPALAECFTISSNRRLYFVSLVVASYLFVMVRSNTILYRYDNILFGTESYDERIIIFNNSASIFL